MIEVVDAPQEVPAVRSSKNRLVLVAALLIFSSILAYLALGGVEKNLVYYYSPEELLSLGSRVVSKNVRLGGMVQVGSIQFDANSLALQFHMGMAPAGLPYVHVKAQGVPPQMFQESMGAVVEGVFDGQYFKADRIMVKHSNEYRPPAEGEDPQALYRTLIQSNNKP